MHDDTLPLAINLTEILPPDGGVITYHPLFAALTSALTAALSGIMAVEDVAAVLRCSVDTVRRIPFDELDTFDGPGRGVLYRMEDVKNYVHRRKRHRKRRSGLGQPVSFRPDPKAGSRNLAADALKALNAGSGA